VTQYLLGMIQPDGDDKTPPPDVIEGIMADVGRIREDLVSQGKWIFGNGLHSSSSTSMVRMQDGKAVVTDGPFVEMKEHLGGVTIIDVADREEALDWARRYAEVTTLPIEVRPFR
jgi:hypothetical protein